MNKDKLINYVSKLVQQFYHSTDKSPTFNIGLVCEEFFHHQLRGFGGFGAIVKNFSKYYNINKKYFKVSAIISQALPFVPNPSIKRFHNANTLIRPSSKRNFTFDLLRYIRLINSLRLKLLISIDYYQSYEYPLIACPSIPLIIYIQDPRDKQEWSKIATVPLEFKVYLRKDKKELIKISKEREISLKKMITLSKMSNRKIIFATSAKSIVRIAERAYGFKLKAYYLPTPLHLPSFKKIKYSKKPSLLFLGRLDPIKRPWIVFELAKRFKEIDFYIAGNTHHPQLMKPIIEKYNNLENLKFLGLVRGRQKEQLLEDCWGLINTSVHEALPVSFLEAFSYGKCVIGCQNPDDLVRKFGFYTGELLGQGFEEKTLNIFSDKIIELLSNEKDRTKKGKIAREHMNKNYSFETFDIRLKRILSQEEIL